MPKPKYCQLFCVIFKFWVTCVIIINSHEVCGRRCQYEEPHTIYNSLIQITSPIVARGVGLLL